MTHERFNEIVEEELDFLKSLLVKKQAEYNLGEDRFDTFKSAAVLEQQTPEQALLGFVAKQITSLYSMVRSGEIFPEALFKEKISDIAVYMILLLGLTEDTGRSKKE